MKQNLTLSFFLEPESGINQKNNPFFFLDKYFYGNLFINYLNMNNLLQLIICLDN